MQSRLYCTRWDGKEKDNAVNDSEYNGNILMLLRSAQEFVKANTRKGWEKLPNGKKIKAEYVERAVLEGLVNHFIHCDYTVMGGEVHLDIYDDRMTITSPGGMYNGTLIQEQDYREVPSDRRNPLLADVMAQLDYMEKRGSGLRKICNATRELDGYSDERHPVFKSTTNHFVTTIYRMGSESDNGNVPKDVPKDWGCGTHHQARSCRLAGEGTFEAHRWQERWRVDCGGYEQVTEHMLRVIKGNLLFAKDIMHLMNLMLCNVLSQG